MGRLRRGLRFLWRGANALSTLQWLWGLLPAGVIAAIVSWVAAAEHVPPVYIGVSALGAFAGVYVAYVARRIGGLQTQPSLSERARQRSLENKADIVADIASGSYHSHTSQGQQPAELPVLSVGLGPDNTPEIKTVYLEIGNSTGIDATGMRARLTDSKPALAEGRRDKVGLPLVLTTKARFDRHRTNLQTLPQTPFEVASGDIDTHLPRRSLQSSNRHSH